MNKIVVLVEPENPRNIGFVARAMKCNNLTALRIVDSSRTEMDRDAYITGVSGAPILDSATFYPTLAEATENCIETVGFSRRSFNNEPIKLKLEDLSEQLPQEGEVALIFGRESQGLSAEELSFCTTLCTIPIKDTMSYNLGQAAAIALYEVAGKEQFTVKGNEKKFDRTTTVKEREVIYNYLRNNSAEKLWKNNNREVEFRRMINNMNLTKDELHFFLGVITSLNK